MNKSFLLIDTPESCVSCRLGKNSTMCPITGTKISEADEVLKDCPLQRMPQKTPCNYNDFEHYVEGYHKGWNDIIDHMTGDWNNYVPEPYRESN